MKNVTDLLEKKVEVCGKEGISFRIWWKVHYEKFGLHV